MAFVGPTTERKIYTSAGKTFKIFLTEQEGGYWVATVLYSQDGLVSTQNFIGRSKESAYESAVTWSKEDLDERATVEPL